MIRANRSNVMKVMKVGVFLRIDSCESPRFAVRIAGSSKVGGCSSRDHDEGCGISSFHVSCSESASELLWLLCQALPGLRLIWTYVVYKRACRKTSPNAGLHKLYEGVLKKLQ